MIKVASAALAVVLLILTFAIFPTVAPYGDLGLCLPSPNQWKIPHFLSWLAGSALLLLSVVVAETSNKKYNFIHDPFSVLTAVLLVLLTCNCIPTAMLSTSTLILLANAVCFFIILSTYEEMNASKEFFIVGTLPAIGAMFQYSFLWMIPVYAGAGILMKSFRLRELIAFLFGIVSPYWIAVGLGWISLDSFRLPESLTIFSKSAVQEDIFITLVTTGITAFLALILALYNGVRLFSRNSRLRSIHMAFNLMGFVAILAIILDFNNFVAWSGTLSLWLALETATLLDLYNIRNYQIAVGLLALIFLPLYIVAL